MTMVLSMSLLLMNHLKGGFKDGQKPEKTVDREIGRIGEIMECRNEIDESGRERERKRILICHILVSPFDIQF